MPTTHDPPSEESLKKFAGATEWANHFDAAISEESTRAKVVLSACYLEELLGHLLKVVLIPCRTSEDPLFDGPQAPLSGFGAKIDLAVRLAVISRDTGTSLHLVRKIRNQFAHRIATCTFEDQKIRDWNAELHRMNDHATSETRARFAPGPVGEFAKSVSWLIFWLKHIIDGLPNNCPHCGGVAEHRVRIKSQAPGQK